MKYQILIFSKFLEINSFILKLWNKWKIKEKLETSLLLQK